MRAMVLENSCQQLILKDIPIPVPNPFEVLIKIKACGVCRTDLHIVEGDLPLPQFPLILGHQIVGMIEQIGQAVREYKVGERVGVPWLGGCCGICEFCLQSRENLCDHAIFTGYIRNGGFAEYCTAHKDFILKLSDQYDDLHSAPLLCSGLIGFRAFRLAQPAKTLGFYGFGSSAHILVQIARYRRIEGYAFTRPENKKSKEFAKSLGVKWVGDSNELPQVKLDSAIIFAPDGNLYPQALKAIKKGGKVISAGIHMSDIPSFPYSLLWEERSISSVANLTKQDGKDFMDLISQVKIDITAHPFSLEQANEALQALKKGNLEGSVVLVP